jgi:hypothetical protein
VTLPPCAALITYVGYVQSMAAVAATTVEGQPAVRIPLNSSSALTYTTLQQIDQVIRSHLAARDLLAEQVAAQALDGGSELRDARKDRAAMNGRPR